GYAPFGAVGPYSVAERVPVHGSTGSGGRIRFAPNGAAAYGIPRKNVTPSAVRPRRGPLWTVTTGPCDVSSIRCSLRNLHQMSPTVPSFGHMSQQAEKSRLPVHHAVHWTRQAGSPWRGCPYGINMRRPMYCSIRTAPPGRSGLP